MSSIAFSDSNVALVLVCKFNYQNKVEHWQVYIVVPIDGNNNKMSCAMNYIGSEPASLSQHTMEPL